MAAVIGIVNGHGLSIEARHRNKPNISKLVLYKPLNCFNTCLKQMYISNNMKCFSFKGGCGVCGHMVSADNYGHPKTLDTWYISVTNKFFSLKI